MTIDHRSASATLAELLRTHTPEELLAKLAPKRTSGAPRVPRAPGVAEEDVSKRWALLHDRDSARAILLDETSATTAPAYARNIENFIGTVRVPVGLAGPVRVNGTYAQGDFYLPLATTEAALVASYSRGAQLITDAGGCSAIVLHEGVSRAPGFAFDSVGEAGKFVAWAVAALPQMRRIAETTTRHGKLRDMRVNLEGNHVYLIFEFATGNAAGQNMVTIATQAICEYIAEHSAVKPRYGFVEANHSGDKKASAQSFLGGRGKSVTCECVVPAELVERRLHTSVETMTRYWVMSALGGVMSGTIGVQGHYANGLTALYLACGQDVACVAESAVGVTRFEARDDGALYAAVTLPNLIVGTVGGGTNLPTQRACLDVLGLPEGGSANAFAEVCAAVALGGELSIVGALAAGHFTSAHQSLAR
ncbi:MAG TPA: hydroxymethylglutaryl-CoA reductase [Gemmatimonadaceae bacterium]|jgi:hydroxymethylglutaryl-CoA reductase (NADPH)|nr:hydroxymethylglutaryl-CoA reductase [Gemmatimonadaceae bacterium]